MDPALVKYNSDPPSSYDAMIVLIEVRHVHKPAQVLQMDWQNCSDYIRVHGCVSSLHWILGVHDRCKLGWKEVQAELTVTGEMGYEREAERRYYCRVLIEGSSTAMQLVHMSESRNIVAERLKGKQCYN